MLKSIAQVAPELAQFAAALNLSLSESQHRHSCLAKVQLC
jgi:hypothetical protein